MAETVPRCRLYLTLPASLRRDRAIPEAMDAADVACVLLWQAAREADPH
jgi:hypothetical protein